MDLKLCFKKCHCGGRPVHGYFFADDGRSAFPGIIMSQRMGRLFLETAPKGLIDDAQKSDLTAAMVQAGLPEESRGDWIEFLASSSPVIVPLEMMVF